MEIRRRKRNRAGNYAHRLATEIKTASAIYTCPWYVDSQSFEEFTSSGRYIPAVVFLLFFQDIRRITNVMTAANLKSVGLTMAVLSFGIVTCIPKFDAGGFVPSSVDYVEKPSSVQDQIAMPSNSQPQLRSEGNASSARSSASGDSNEISDRSHQEPRFGFTNIGSTGSGYGVSTYSPAKIDLGGLILGAVIGVGTILIIPKLLYVLSGTYGAYARSDEGGFTNAMTKFDDVLARHGIDTTSCMQRAVCTYAKKAADAVREANDISDEEKVTSFDRMVENLTTNQVFRTAMRGTAIQDAVEAGRGGQSCSRTYRHCGFSLETILGLVSNVMSSMTAHNDSGPTAHSGPL